MSKLHEVTYEAACKKLVTATLDVCANDPRAKFAFVALELDPFAVVSNGLDPAKRIMPRKAVGE